MKFKSTLLLGAVCACLSTQAFAKETLRVGYNNWVGFIPLFVALEEGDFSKAGLTVEAKSFDAPGDGLIPLVANQLDIHFSTADAVILRAGALPGKFKIVALMDTSAGADAVVAAKGIDGVKGLKGKKVGVTLNECGHIMLEKALIAEGMTEKDVKLINMAPDMAGTALAAGKVDAAVTWEPWISQIIGTGGSKIYSSLDAPGLILDCTVVTTKALKTKRAEFETFMTIIYDRMDYVLSHPAEASKIVEERMDIPAAEIEGILTEIKLYSASESIYEMNGAALTASQEVADFLLKKKLLRKAVDVAGLMDTSLIPTK